MLTPKAIIVSVKVVQALILMENFLPEVRSVGILKKS